MGRHHYGGVPGMPNRPRVVRRAGGREHLYLVHPDRHLAAHEGLAYLGSALRHGLGGQSLPLFGLGLRVGGTRRGLGDGG